MPSNISIIEQKLQLLSILSNGNSLIKFEDIIKERKLKVKITDTISNTKAISMDLSIIANEMIGKITTDNTKPIIGIAINNSLANSYNEIITYGIIQEDSLTGGTIGQAVYIDGTGSLTLAPTGLRIGRLLSTSSPVYVWINPGREYDETQEFLILNRTLYFALRYLSYYLPFTHLDNYPLSDPGGFRYPNATGLGFVNGALLGGGAYSPQLNFSATVTTDVPLVGNQWESVAWGNNVFVAVASTGTGRVATSPDGIIWTLQTASQANQWKSIAFGNGLFVAVSIDGTNRVMTSPDGITWTNRTAAAANQWQSIVFDGTQFVAAANSGTNRIMTSPDGITWTGISGTSTVSGYVEYGNGTFLASTSTGYLISTNGAIWKPTLAKTAGTQLAFNRIDGVFYSKFGLFKYSRSAEL